MPTTRRHARSASTGEPPARPLSAALAGVALVAAAGWYVRSRCRNAEAALPPRGDFVGIDGMRLHWIERGSGPVVVLLHGMGGRIDELVATGLVDTLAQRYRVIVLDPPGFGHSTRPWTAEHPAETQAALIDAALDELGVGEATVVAHSWGTLVALALAIHHPARVHSLVLCGGYTSPSRRPSALVLSAPTWPIVGFALRSTVWPILVRIAWPLLLRAGFWPSAIPQGFRKLPVWAFISPARLHAVALESACVREQAARLRRRYRDIEAPAVILCGARDCVLSARKHARALHRALPRSSLCTLGDAGHMLPHTHQQSVLDAVDAVRRAGPPGGTAANLAPPGVAPDSPTGR